MGRDATKAIGNPWFEARKNASKYNDKLCSREGAAELLGMSSSSVADAELGITKCMPVDKAVLMADLYNAPQLLNHYCLNECPIGCRHSISEDLDSIERVTVKLLRCLKIEDLDKLKDKMLKIASNGIVSEDDFDDLKDVISYLDNIGKIISQIKMIGEIAMKGLNQNED